MNSNKLSSLFKKIVNEIEDLLARTYQFPIQTSIINHVFHESDSKHHPDLSFDSNNAQILLYPNKSDEEDIFIGFFCPQKLLKELIYQNPLAHLSTNNLNSLLVLIEEISHFHLIINRISKGRLTSKLELEWQGEVDKVLISSIIMRRQSGDSHLLPLIRKIFDQASFHNPDTHYREASKFAARFWYHLYSHRDGIWDPENSAVLHSILSKLYRQAWPEKFKEILTHSYLKDILPR